MSIENDILAVKPGQPEVEMDQAINAALNGEAADMVSPSQLSTLRTQGFYVPSDHINYADYPASDALVLSLADAKQRGKIEALAGKAGVAVSDLLAVNLDRNTLVTKQGRKISMEGK